MITYDEVGNRTQVVEGRWPRTTWSYDANYRLTNENRNGNLAWDSLTPDQWSQMTPDEWANLPVSGPARPTTSRTRMTPCATRNENKFLKI